MGEYIKYKGDAIKIGTCEELYYTDLARFAQALQNGELSKDVGSDEPCNYLIPAYGYRFRFPFPDEDHLSLGQLTQCPFERGLLITIERNATFAKGEFPELNRTYKVEARHQENLNRALPMGNPNNFTELVDIEIVQQKMVVKDGELRFVLVYRCPYANEKWRMEDEADIQHIVGQISQRYIDPEQDEDAKAYWQAVNARILKGYRPIPIGNAAKPITTEIAAHFLNNYLITF